MTTDKLTVEDIERLMQRGRTVSAELAPVVEQLLEVMRENERLREAMKTIPRNSLSCHIETHLNNALHQHKESYNTGTAITPNETPIFSGVAYSKMADKPAQD